MRRVELPAEWFERTAQGLTEFVIDADKVTHVTRDSFCVMVHFVGGSCQRLEPSEETRFQEILDLLLPKDKVDRRPPHYTGRK